MVDVNEEDKAGDLDVAIKEDEVTIMVHNNISRTMVTQPKDITNTANNNKVTDLRAVIPPIIVGVMERVRIQDGNVLLRMSDTFHMQHSRIAAGDAVISANDN